MSNNDKQSCDHILLAIHSSPPLRTFNNLGVSIGIIDKHVTNYTPWLLEHFFGLHYKKSWRAIVFNMPYSFHWKCFQSRLALVTPFRKTVFINNVKKNLRKGYYIYLTVNERYLPHRFAYQKADFLHDLYVLGFDEKSQGFTTLAYNDKQKFEFELIPYETVYQGFRNKLSNFYFIPFRLKENYQFAEIHLNKIKSQARHYLFPRSKHYGIHIYKYIKEHLSSSADIKVALFRALMEHNYVLTNLKPYGINYDENYRLSKIAFINALKYNFTKEESLLKQIKELLCSIEEGERSALSRFLETE